MDLTVCIVWFLHTAIGSVVAEWSTGPWQNMNEGGWRVTARMTGWGQGWHTLHSRCWHRSLCVSVASVHIKGTAWHVGSFIFFCLCTWQGNYVICHFASHLVCKQTLLMVLALWRIPPAVTLSLNVRNKTPLLTVAERLGIVDHLHYICLCITEQVTDYMLHIITEAVICWYWILPLGLGSLPPVLQPMTFGWVVVILKKLAFNSVHYPPLPC